MKKDLFTIPNLLCYFRILLVPAFLYVFLNAANREDYLFAAGIILIGGVTDFLDGFIARKCNMLSLIHISGNWREGSNPSFSAIYFYSKV